MKYTLPIKGYVAQKAKTPIGETFAERKFIVDTLYEMKVLKSQIDNTIVQAESTIDEMKKGFESSVQETQNQLIEMCDKLLGEIHSIKQIQGEPGKDADEDSIVNKVLSKIPKVDTDQIKKDILSSVPKVDMKGIKKEILSSIPDQKADLKIIQESIEVDPMSVIDKIMALPDEKLKSFKLKSGNIDGLEQTISAMRNQLSRGYLHGSGLSTVSHDTTLTGDGTHQNPLSVVGGGGGTLTAEIPTGTIDGTNTDFIVTATPVLFYWNGQLQNPLVSPPDYVYDSLTMTITMTTAPSPGDNLLSYHQ